MKFNFRLEDIKYVKILYRDNNGNPASIKAALKRISDREIYSCAKFSEKLNINTPQDVSLSIICHDGLYRTKTRLKSIENEPPYVLFFLDTPQGIEYQQNREYFRIPVDYRCIYKIEENDEIKEFNAKVVDISANGVSIELPTHSISEGASEIEIGVKSKIILAKIRYVRSEKTNDGYRISFAYTKISEQDRDFISQVCLQKQLEQRRNSIK